MKPPRPPRPIDAAPIESADGGDTKVHYLPNEPRAPAGSEETIALLKRYEEIDKTPVIDQILKRAAERSAETAEASTIAAAPELEASSTPVVAPELLQLPQMPIAEMFQETLWRAFHAGALAADPTYEAFARWYALEVLG